MAAEDLEGHDQIAPAALQRKKLVDGLTHFHVHGDEPRRPIADSRPGCVREVGIGRPRPQGPLRGCTVAPVVTQPELEDLVGFRLLVEPWLRTRQLETSRPATVASS